LLLINSMTSRGVMIPSPSIKRFLDILLNLGHAVCHLRIIILLSIERNTETLNPFWEIAVQISSQAL
jgi:hypothetical protein